MAATDYFEGLVLGHALHGSPFSVSPWYVGLWVSDPTRAGLMAGEVSAGDYQRRQITFSGTTANTVNWAAATTNWGFVTHVGLCDTQTAKAGKVLIFEEFGELEVSTGVAVTIPNGGLTVRAY